LLISLVSDCGSESSKDSGDFLSHLVGIFEVVGMEVTDVGGHVEMRA